MEVKRSNNVSTTVSNLGVSDSKRAQVEKNSYEGRVDSASNRRNGVNVSLSEAAKKRTEQIKTAHEIASNTSPIREDRVNELKAKIADGTYHIDSGKIADGILMEAVKDEVASANL